MVFDEFQWIAGRYGNLVGHLKCAWDNLFLKNNRVHLMLCGSISSFMAKKVIRSKALYGRVDCELALQPLLLPEIIKGADIRRSAAELIEMYMLTGGRISEYLENLELAGFIEKFACIGRGD